MVVLDYVPQTDKTERSRNSSVKRRCSHALANGTLLWTCRGDCKAPRTSWLYFRGPSCGVKGNKKGRERSIKGKLSDLKTNHWPVTIGSVNQSQHKTCELNVKYADRLFFWSLALIDSSLKLYYSVVISQCCKRIMANTRSISTTNINYGISNKTFIEYIDWKHNYRRSWLHCVRWLLQSLVSLCHFEQTMVNQN